ncbi:MAG: insulinase family protein [Candidatus Eisenbacteria sp.]|nr:insulinase family protein [Candidatus Eisenbacteria bacterium]
MTKSAIVLLLVMVVSVGLLLPEAGLAGKVKHPDKLKFPDLEYTPPDAGSYEVTLGSGIPAFIAEDREVPTFDLRVYVRTGIAYEPADKAGLADMMAYLMRNGGTRSFTPEELDDRVEYLAGSISCAMRMTSATVTISTLSKDMDEALDILLEILRYPAFDPTEVERRREDRIQELKLRNNELRKIEAREWAFLIYGDHPYTKQFRETQASMESISVDDLRAFHEKYFFPGNFIIAAAGDFDSRDLVRKLDRVFSGWSSRELDLPEIPEVMHTPVPGVYIVNKEDVNQARVRIGHLGIRRDTPDYFAVKLMNYVLGGGGFASRIVQRVRSDEGLSYSQGSRFSTPVWYDGDFRAYFQTKPSTVAFGTSIILEEIDRIREEPVDQETLENAKQNTRSMLVNNFVDKWNTVRTLANDFLTRRPKDYWKNYETSVQAVTVEEVQEAARKYLHPDRMVFLVVGNADDVRNGTTEKSPAKVSDFGRITELPLSDPLSLER